MKKIALISCLGLTLSFNLAHADYEEPETGLMPGQTELAVPLSSTATAPSLTSELEVAPSTQSVEVNQSIPEEPPRLRSVDSSYERLQQGPAVQATEPEPKEALEVIEVVVEEPQSVPAAVGPDSTKESSPIKPSLSQSENNSDLPASNDELEHRKCLQEGKGFFAATGCLVGKFGASIEKTPEVAKEVWSGVVSGSQKIGEALKENTQDRKEPAPIEELNPKKLSK